MAILKHKTSKNMSYGDVLDYYEYKHEESDITRLYAPILDENGLMQERENFAVCYLDGAGREHDPEDWARACTETNLRYHKNNTKGERKNHEYIISHPESDTDKLSKEALLEEGKAFVRENLKGYDALIGVHMDTDNCHLHITINSVRALEREEQPWMMRNEDGKVYPCELRAGGKHQNNPEFRRHCQQWLMEYSRDHGFTVEDNLKIEDQRKQERYAEKHTAVRSKLLETASRSTSMEDLQNKLKEEHEIVLVRRGNTYSLHLPDSKKAMRLNRLDLTCDDLYQAMRVTEKNREKLIREHQFEIEKKHYIQWLRERRQKNSIRAEDTIADVAAAIAGKTEKLTAAEYRELRDLLKQTTYLERDLQTELDKIDRLLDRWLGYRNPDLPSQEHQSHDSYIRWCGCDPDSHEGFLELRMEHDLVELQIQEAKALRDALVSSASQWKVREGESFFQYQHSWTITNEDRLKHRLKSVKANRKKLEQIAFRCETAAGHRIYKEEHLQKAAHFRELWHQKLMEENILKEQLRQLQKEKRQARKSRALER